MSSLVLAHDGNIVSPLNTIIFLFLKNVLKQKTALAVSSRPEADERRISGRAILCRKNFFLASFFVGGNAGESIDGKRRKMVSRGLAHGMQMNVIKSIDGFCVFLPVIVEAATIIITSIPSLMLQSCSRHFGHRN